MPRILLAAALAALGLGALLLGRGWLTVLVLGVAVAVLVELTELLGRAGARPVLPVALVPGLVLPAMVAGDVAVDPAAGWDRIPGAFAVAFLLGFALVLVFGRRAGAVAGLAATATASLLVGLGASAVLLLRGLPDGVTWLLAVGLLVVAADVAGPLLRRLAAGEQGPGRRGAVVSPGAALVPGAVAVAVVAALLWAVLGPPLEPLVLLVLALVALVAALTAGYLRRALVAEARRPGRDGRGADGRGADGLVLGAVDALLLAAPAAYVLVRAVAL